MRALRVILVVLGVFLVLGGLGAGAAFYFTQGATTAADSFFHAIATDGPEAAYDQAASSFRATTPRAEFAAAARQLGLGTYQSANWSSRSIENSKASLDGTLSLAGGALPAKVELAKDDSGVWRVLTLSLPTTGLERTGGAPPASAEKPALPGTEEAHMMAQASFQQLAEAIKARNFESIYLTTTPGFQGEFSLDQVAQQFKVFSDHDVDLTRTDTTRLVIDPPPHLDANDQLVLKGSQPTPQQPWYFGFTYAHKPQGWMLTGLSLSAKPD